MGWETIASISLAVASPLFTAGGAWALIDYRVKALTNTQDTQAAELAALRAEIRTRDAEERKHREATEAREREALSAMSKEIGELRLAHERASSELRLALERAVAELRADARVLAAQRGTHLDEGSAPKKRG